MAITNQDKKWRENMKRWKRGIALLAIVVQIPLHRFTDSASNGSVFPVVTEHFSASSVHAFL